MQISWKDFLKRKLYKPSKLESVGIAFTAEQVLLCVLKRDGDAITWCLDASFSHHQWQQNLAEFVKKNKLQGAPCYFSLSSHWYKSMQIDRPDVAEEELHAAIKWPLQEVSGAQQDLTYDYVDLPVQVAGQNKVMVVALVKSEIEKISRAIFEAELNLQSITVEDFATVNLLPPSSEATITLVQEHGEEVVINIVKNGMVYFSRQLKGFENIGSFSEQELEMGVADSLGVQVQRTMDFFESQLRQAPVKKILMKLDTTHEKYLADKISAAMGAVCLPFEPDIQCDSELTFKMASFSCLGAAAKHFKTEVAKRDEINEVAN